MRTAVRGLQGQSSWVWHTATQREGHCRSLDGAEPLGRCPAERTNCGLDAYVRFMRPACETYTDFLRLSPDQVLLDALTHAFVGISRLALLIFDEGKHS